MTKIYIDLDERNTKMHLDNVIRELDGCLRLNLRVPSDFNRRSKFNTIKQDVININNEVKKIQAWLLASKKEYENIEDRLEATIKSIPKVSTIKLESIVR